jgi:hypothetical protein
VNRRRNRDDWEPEDDRWDADDDLEGADDTPDADSFGYDSDPDEEDEEYRDFIAREFGDDDQEPRRFMTGKTVIVYALLISFILPFLLVLLQSFTR